jgi:hypothetical protein
MKFYVNYSVDLPSELDGHKTVEDKLDPLPIVYDIRGKLEQLNRGRWGRNSPLEKAESAYEEMVPDEFIEVRDTITSFFDGDWRKACTFDDLEKKITDLTDYLSNLHTVYRSHILDLGQEVLINREIKEILEYLGEREWYPRILEFDGAKYEAAMEWLAHNFGPSVEDDPEGKWLFIESDYFYGFAFKTMSDAAYFKLMCY